jgi:tetratricopeptide (TPR) repeat protein
VINAPDTDKVKPIALARQVVGLSMPLRMKKLSIYGMGIFVVLLLSMSLAPASLVAAQGEQTRGLTVKVGATRQESDANRDVQLWAVLIGIARYKNGDQTIGGSQIPNLKSAADDAQAMYEFLRSPEGGGFVPESEGGHMVLLKDEQATKAAVVRALATLKRSKPDDYFVIYIAAHGTITPQLDPRSNKTEIAPYFIMHDTDPLSIGETGLRMLEFQEIVKQIPARKGLVLSDTCHSAGVQLAGRGLHVTDTKLANNNLIKAMESIEGVGFISAADQTELSYESDERGVFTQCLLQGLGGSADSDRDGMVTFVELKNYLREEVPKCTDGKQHPFFNTTTLEANNIPLSIVHYPEAGNRNGSAAGDGLLILRSPDVDGVSVAVDGQQIATLNTSTERVVRVPSGNRMLSFTKGTMKRNLQATVQPGKSTVVEINLTFSRDEDDDLAGRNEQQTNVYLSEDKEPSQEAKDLFYKGVDSFNRQKFQEAADLLNRAIRANGNAYADAFVYRGRAQQSLGRDEAAVADYQAVLALRPSDYQVRTLLADAKFRAGHDKEEVVRDLKDIILHHPNDDFARVVYADVLLTRRDLIGAEKQVRRAITIRRRSPPAHMILAEALTYQDSKSKQQEAVDEAEKALSLLTELSQKQVSLARGLKGLSISHIIFGGGRYINSAAMSEAHYLAAKAIDNLVNREDAPPDTASLLDRARTHIQESIKLAQGDKRRLMLALDTSAKTYFLKGDDAGTIRDAEQALKIIDATPQLTGYAEPHYVLSLAYENGQKYAKAYEHLKKYIDLSRSSMSPDDLKEKEDRLEKLRQSREANRQK